MQTFSMVVHTCDGLPLPVASAHNNVTGVNVGVNAGVMNPGVHAGVNAGANASVKRV
jgi:hypothetical protein